MERLYPQDIDLHTLSPLALAFVGDGVYSLLVRERLLSQANRPVNELHKQSVRDVRAEAQAAAMERLMPHLTEEEEAVFKRGRNAHVSSIPPKASRSEYLKATALESLLGYLYLHAEIDRINELFCAMMEEETNHAT